MFERFTDRARRVIVLAQEQARMLGHNYIGSEHLLLGLCADNEGASHVLRVHDVTYEGVRTEVLSRVVEGQPPSGHIPFTPDAKKAMEGALKECAQLGHREIRSEHLLLGLMRDKKSTGARVIAKLADDVDALRKNVVTSASGPPEAASAAVSMSAPMSAGFAAARIVAPMQPGPLCAVCGRDLWDVDRFVRGERGSVCDACVHNAMAAFASTNERESTMPPRGYGDPAPEPQELQAIQAAFAGGLAGDAVEDGAALRPFVDQAAARNPGLSVQLVVHRVRLVDPDHAQVRFAMVVSNGMHIPMEGNAVRREGRWLVARSTVVALLQRGGVQVPD
jgi:hypothetical protein